ncbi:hypothetical protein [Methylibium sp.]|uniref:hypothetical protein n=1 Tax=Methylibium sp. TaxID=2067992 RepID=UPI00286AC5C1|nr:hypothetical protein [Methylibium sp.]
MAERIGAWLRQWLDDELSSAILMEPPGDATDNRVDESPAGQAAALPLRAPA